jgi:hypothetical protein
VTEALASAAQVVAAYSVQLAAVVVTGLALCGLLRLRAPRVHLAVAQALLVLALALPWLQPPRRGGGPSGHVTVTAVAWGLAPGPAAGTLPAVAGLLALGAAWRLARLARGVWRLRRCRRLSRVLPPSPPVRDAWARVGVEARVVVSEEVDVPAAFGVLRPVVLVPGRFTVLGEAAQRAVLCHELLHVRRHDWLQMLAEEVAGALLWFHPAVWWLRARIPLAREQVVDQEAVALTGDRRV